VTTGGPAGLLELAEPVLTLPGTDGVEVHLHRADTAVTRFADSRIHQNTARVDGEARVRVVLEGGRVGVAVTNDLTADGMRAVARRAREIARLTPADPRFPGLATPAPYPDAGVDDPATAGCPPAERARLVAALLAELPTGVIGAGTVETGRLETAVATSTGVRAEHAGTSAQVSLVASRDGADGASGYAEDAAPRLADLDVAGLGRRAAGKVAHPGGVRTLPPGTYRVILEPGATVVLTQWLAWVAFPAKAVAEGRSPLSGRLGQRVCDERVTIVDDPLSGRLPGAVFDAEGTPKCRHPLIERGVATGVTHDRATAAAAGTASTGHALPAPNPDGGIATHILIEPGTSGLDELVAGCERGVYVTRFHYTNLVHPIESTITGMTRDGTFLVEDGRLAAPVRNMRFTSSILAALSAVEAMGREVQVASDLFYGAAAAPAMRLSAFTFTSATTH
jgi:PmbA protein